MDIKTADNFSPYEVLTDELEGDRAWDLFFGKYSTLTEPVRNILVGDEAMSVLYSISQQLLLDIADSRALSEIVANVLLGDLFINDMTTTIAQKLNVDQSTAQQIQAKIVKELFAPAIEDIKKIQRDKFPDRIGQGTTPAQPTIPQPPAPPQMENTPPVNQSNVIDLRNQS